jgi:polyisoprenoid-binding protein YceI
MLLSLVLLACQPVAEPVPPAPPEAPELPVKTPVDLVLDVTAGTVSVVTIKNGDAPVPGTLDGVTGSITLGATPSGSLEIALSSWDSGLELRDERVQETFFHAAENPTATFTLSGLEGEVPAPGASSTVTVSGALALYTGSQDIQTSATLTQVAPGAFELTTPEPFNVEIAALGMGDNLSELMTLCAHKSVDDAVATTVTLSLQAR